MAQRRTKIEVLNEKISKVDSKIAACTEKIAALEDEKTALAAQLDEIRKGSYRSCQPKHPIQENLKKQATEQPALTPAPGSRAEAPHPAANSLDQMIALYNLEDDE